MKITLSIQNIGGLDSLVVQWLGTWSFLLLGLGSIPAGRTKNPSAVQNSLNPSHLPPPPKNPNKTLEV